MSAEEMIIETIALLRKGDVRDARDLTEALWEYQSECGW